MGNSGFSHKWIVLILIVDSHCTSEVAKPAEPSSEGLTLSNEYWYAEWLDTAGYSDKFWWGPSPRHNHSGYHEMLSGEWGAAIYYDGISTGSEAMWLTDKFLCPNWETYCDFTIDYSPVSWDNESNPVDGLDTGYSRIKNAKVRITIDYEMVDLGEQGENGEGGSPLSFGSLVGADAFVYSERYVLLQTYTITNITQSPIENLEFYQMLHGHPGNEYNAVVYSVYDDTDHEDPLEDYVPYNDVHTVGNFRHDITQWNNVDDPEKDEYVDHRDWIGFSSLVAPDFIENGVYEGHGLEPISGTHRNIEARDLNENPHSFGQVAGAMGWTLGTLDAAGGQNDSVSLTLAIMFGAAPVQRSCGELEAEAHWGLDETSGDVAHDWIGANDGTLVGDPEWVYDGYIGGALEFDGAGDYVELSDPVGALTGESVTISAWVKPGQDMLSSTTYDILSQTKGSPGSLFGYDLYWDINTSGACRPAFSLNYPDCYARSDDAIARNEWAWVVGTNDGANLKVYVNGELKKSAVSTGRMGVYADAYIGYMPGDDPFIGVIDCVWVFSCPWDPEQGCLPFCNEHYDQWIEMGRPDCWCTPYQCDGDADGINSGVPFYYRVYTGDMALIIANWKKKMGDPALNPCADIDHISSGEPYRYRVYTGDMAKIIENWKKYDKDNLSEPPSMRLPGDCPERGCQRGALGGGSPGTELSSKELLTRLAEIWLDPEVQKTIDEEKFLKVYESIKGL